LSTILPLVSKAIPTLYRDVLIVLEDSDLLEKSVLVNDEILFLQAKNRAIGTIKLRRAERFRSGTCAALAWPNFSRISEQHEHWRERS